MPASSPIAAQADAGAVAAADPASAAALLDAAPADAPHPAPPGDAAIAPATPPHVAQKDAPPAAPAHAGYGTLNVTSSPIAAVTIDGTSYGDTPALNIRLSAGPHRVVLENTDAHYLKRVPVTITANQVNNLDLTH